MRILFISNFYPPNDLGGMELRCQETVQRLQARGHDCHVLTSRYGVDGQSQPEEGVTRTLHLQGGIDYYRPLDFFLRRPEQERANGDALRQALESFQPDVIFIWGLWNLSLRVAYWAEQWMPGRVAYSVAGYWFIMPGVHEAYWQHPARHLWAKVIMAPFRQLALHILARDKKRYPLALQRVTCVSEYVRRKLSEAGVLPQVASVIYNGIEPQPFLDAATDRTSDRQNMRLVYTGGIVAHKGVLTAVEALGLLEQNGKAQDLHLTLVGGGHPEYEVHLRHRVAELALRERVTFRGRVPRDEIAGILSDHDIFLFTSVYEEPIARTVMEAMAANLAIVGTDVGGQREMLEDGVNALVYPPDDAVKLAECILTLQRDPGLRSRLAAAGRQTVLERFTLNRMVDEMEAWLQEIVG